MSICREVNPGGSLYENGLSGVHGFSSYLVVFSSLVATLTDSLRLQRHSMGNISESPSGLHKYLDLPEYKVLCSPERHCPHRAEDARVY